ncbi:hypothetical protein [Chromohalobacter sp. 296-RDG]|uniref:hypothetical protein n=1 Tax=Chromohalobacter sp. 296-RDG TaxID=2994062 RepID=UPI002469ABD5|nr:hypothetical protein [Chromohalobacter sp. 296-RDG]
MTVPFNSAVINGGASPVVWAEGLLEADARSSAGADRIAYAILDSASATGASSATPVRQARVGGGAHARGVITPFQPVRITPSSPLSPVGESASSGVPYRARQVDGLPAKAVAELSSPDPQRLVRIPPEYRDGGPLNGESINGMATWVDGLVATSEAFTDNRVIDARLVDAQGVAEAVADATSPEIPVTRAMDPRRMRTASLAFARSQDVSKIRVRQVGARGPAIARARSRATPNTILGFGWSYCDAESSLSAADVYVARAVYPGDAKAAASSTTQAHLVRIIKFLFQASARLIASPDILSGDTRYAYAWGSGLAEASASSPIARRFPLFDAVPIEGVAQASLVPRFEPRSRAIHEAEANATLDDDRLTILHRVPTNPRFEAEARMPATPTVLRDGRGNAIGEAVSIISATRLIAKEANGQSMATAEAVGDNIATLYMTGQAEGVPALSAAGAARLAFMTAVDADGAGSVSMEASIYTIVSVESSQVAADAQSRAIALRVRTMAPVPMTGSASIPPHSFKINAGDPAPAKRTFTVPRVDRQLAIPDSPREYRIT